MPFLASVIQAKTKSHFIKERFVLSSAVPVVTENLFSQVLNQYLKSNERLPVFVEVQ